MTQSELTRQIKDLRSAPAGTRRKTIAGNSADFTQGNSGTISGYFSVFAQKVKAGTYDGQLDSYGDIVDPGAFEGTIKRRRATGKPWPLLYNHDFNQIIGRVTDIRTDKHGAFFTAEFFPTERAQEIRAFCKAGVLYQFSWAFDTIKSEKVKLLNGSTANCLREVELYEITITGIPAEPRAQMTDIKGKKENFKVLYEKLIKDQDATKAAEAIQASVSYSIMAAKAKAAQKNALNYINNMLNLQIAENLEYMAKFQRNPEKTRLLEKAFALRWEIPSERLKWHRQQAERARADIKELIEKKAPAEKIGVRERALEANLRDIEKILKKWPELK